MVGGGGDGEEGGERYKLPGRRQVLDTASTTGHQLTHCVIRKEVVRRGNLKSHHKLFLSFSVLLRFL